CDCLIFLFATVDQREHLPRLPARHHGLVSRFYWISTYFALFPGPYLAFKACFCCSRAFLCCSRAFSWASRALSWAAVLRSVVGAEAGRLAKDLIAALQAAIRSLARGAYRDFGPMPLAARMAEAYWPCFFSPSAWWMRSRHSFSLWNSAMRA